tara:strand:+ start:308 stop:862 length:555 start_codon:yes stop_codon:yes gene_type:complete
MKKIKKFRKIIDCHCLFSNCKSYRWSLDIKISRKVKEIIFIGLNPSISNEYLLDNTTKKIIKICDKNNYGRIILINLFGLISTSPKLLETHADPVGISNNKIIEYNINYWSKSNNCDLWIGWGNKGNLFNRNIQVSKIIKKYISIKKKKFSKNTKPLLINKTKYNNPIHPLYCLDNSKLLKFNL